MTGRERGFTIIEVMIAMMILTSAVVLVANSWSGNFTRVRKMRTNHEVAMLLQKLATETRLKYMDRVQELPEEEAGEFEDHPGYTWELKTQDFIMPNITSFLGEGADANRPELALVDQYITDFINKGIIKEVTLTVVSQHKKSTTKFSLNTYFVDFNQAPAMPGLGGTGQ